MTAPVLELDEQTLAEIAPPCDPCQFHGQTRTAEWVVRFSPCKHGANVYLECTACKDRTLRIDTAPGPWCCTASRNRCTVHLVSIEPL